MLSLCSTNMRLGFVLVVMQILGLPSGVTQIFAFLDTNMLISPMRIMALGV